jgi:hypothetical protein
MAVNTMSDSRNPNVIAMRMLTRNHGNQHVIEQLVGFFLGRIP